MALIESLDGLLGFRKALIVGCLAAAVALVAVMPLAMRKLRGAGIVGKDIHKPGTPPIPEMGGLAVYIAFHIGVFIVLAFAFLDRSEETLVLVSLVVGAGAVVTGILDDLVRLRQQFKAFIPIAFSIPLALYVQDYSIAFPLLGEVHFGILYAIVLVPLAVAAASNGFNMLEGFNGLGSGLALIIIAAMSAMALLSGQLLGLVVLAPLGGAVAAFLYYNAYPAKIFPGDTFTLFLGALVACASILSQIEFWSALLFVPHVIEFFLKAKARFSVQSFANRIEEGTMNYDGPIRSLTHLFMKSGRWREAQLVLLIWTGHGLWTGLVLCAFILTT